MHTGTQLTQSFLRACVTAATCGYRTRQHTTGRVLASNLHGDTPNNSRVGWLDSQRLHRSHRTLLRRIPAPFPLHGVSSLEHSAIGNATRA